MALGTLTIIEKLEGAYGMGKVYRCTIVGDGAYGAGGSAGLLAKLQAATQSTVDILAVVPQSSPATVSELAYDHSNDKLFARVRATGVESAVADQSAITYQLCIFAK